MLQEIFRLGLHALPLCMDFIVYFSFGVAVLGEYDEIFGDDASSCSLPAFQLPGGDCESGSNREGQDLVIVEAPVEVPSSAAPPSGMPAPSGAVGRSPAASFMNVDVPDVDMEWLYVSPTVSVAGSISGAGGKCSGACTVVYIVLSLACISACCYLVTFFAWFGGVQM